MIKYLSKFLLLGALFVGALSAQAQVGLKGIGSTGADDLVKSVEVFNGCEYKVVSLTGTAGSTQITTGCGVLTAIELQAVTTLGATSATAFGVEVYDSATTTGLTFGIPKLTPDQVGGGMVNSQTGARSNNPQIRPVRFLNGIAIKYPSGAEKGTIGFYWIK